MTNKQIINRVQRDLGAFNASLNPNGNRATGRTFRMLLQAVLACSSAKERKTIYVIGIGASQSGRVPKILSEVVFMLKIALII
ncbi:hypothetical protein VPH1254_0033 [Vibrio phage 1254]|nr:hypothetical protein SIPHO018v1_100031 [Vibrio phage 11E33.1]QZI86725.1 hypothetical protein SIPHO019v1_70002 [Vibrio phage 82E32.1]QZI92565.1 hypothetical protein SIPHO017v1_p0032 [Vibrio phage 19E33.1]QZI92824.1 hypothetical protein SIPHO016v1_p0045 [Vibrio phage 38E33.6a]QZI92950.1 hypothetical protein SIPHO015v1_p0012 [Vibrio phage 82E32.2]QZI93031.1 hypothetical protein SIPHO014v1_p0032 [Vibrio phage 82E32.3]QZI93078.1 hypothetical protein SIPHO013v1_p0017 [Vibrio phage 82E33.2]